MDSTAPVEACTSTGEEPRVLGEDGITLVHASSGAVVRIDPAPLGIAAETVRALVPLGFALPINQAVPVCDAGEASMQAAFWRARALELGAAEDEYRRRLEQL